MRDIMQQLEKNGYDFAVAIATQAEIEAGAACGQLSIITENNYKWENNANTNKQ